jgi:hypothetical protein
MYTRRNSPPTTLLRSASLGNNNRLRSISSSTAKLYTGDPVSEIRGRSVIQSNPKDAQDVKNKDFAIRNAAKIREQGDILKNKGVADDRVAADDIAAIGYSNRVQIRHVDTGEDRFFRYVLVKIINVTNEFPYKEINRYVGYEVLKSLLNDKNAKSNLTNDEYINMDIGDNPVPDIPATTNIIVNTTIFDEWNEFLNANIQIGKLEKLTSEVIGKYLAKIRNLATLLENNIICINLARKIKIDDDDPLIAVNKVNELFQRIYHSNTFIPPPLPPTQTQSPPLPPTRTQSPPLPPTRTQSPPLPPTRPQSPLTPMEEIPRPPSPKSRSQSRSRPKSRSRSPPALLPPPPPSQVIPHPYIPPTLIEDPDQLIPMHLCRAIKNAIEECNNTDSDSVITNRITAKCSTTNTEQNNAVHDMMTDIQNIVLLAKYQYKLNDHQGQGCNKKARTINKYLDKYTKIGYLYYSHEEDRKFDQLLSKFQKYVLSLDQIPTRIITKIWDHRDTNIINLYNKCIHLLKIVNDILKFTYQIPLKDKYYYLKIYKQPENSIYKEEDGLLYKQFHFKKELDHALTEIMNELTSGHCNTNKEENVKEICKNIKDTMINIKYETTRKMDEIFEFMYDKCYNLHPSQKGGKRRCTRRSRKPIRKTIRRRKGRRM